MNFGDGNRAYVSTPNYLRQGAAIAKDLGVKPELEIFDTGNLWFVKQMIKEGLLDGARAHSAVHGHPLGRPGRRRPPAGDGQLPAARTATGARSPSAACRCRGSAQSILLGGNVRVGLEDNLYLSKGVYASNAQLVEKARTIIEAMGARVLTAAQAREQLQLR